MLAFTVDDDYFRIPSMDYYGDFCRSPSGEWIFSWMQGVTHGMSDDGLVISGIVLLFNTRSCEVVLHGEAERPAMGSVADNGSFCFVDMGFDAHGGHRFQVFDSQGDPKIKEDFVSHVNACAISKSGIYSVCKTGGSNKSGADGNTLYYYGLEVGRRIYKVHPKTGFTESFSFDEAAGALIVNEKGMGSYRYNSAGVFLDGDQYRKACVSTGRFMRYIWDILELHKSGPVSADQAEQSLAFLQSTNVADLLGTNNESFWYAALGKTLDALGDSEGALSAYDNALLLYPGIGVKRRADALRKNK